MFTSVVAHRENHHLIFVSRKLKGLRGLEFGRWWHHQPVEERCFNPAISDSRFSPERRRPTGWNNPSSTVCIIQKEDGSEFQFLLKIKQREKESCVFSSLEKLKLTSWSRVEILILNELESSLQGDEMKWRYWNWDRTLEWIRLRVKSNQLFCSIDNIGNIGTVVQVIEFEIVQ